MAAETNQYPIEFVYNDNIIHEWKDGTCTGYYFNADGDIEEVCGKTINEVKRKLDKVGTIFA